MLSSIERPFAGLVLPDDQAPDTPACLAAVAECLARVVPSQPVRALDSETLIAGHYGVRVTADPDGPCGPRIMLEMATPQGLLADTRDLRAAAILAEAVLACLKVVPADFVEWYGDGHLIAARDVARLRATVPQDTALAPLPGEAIRLQRFARTDPPAPSGDDTHRAPSPRLAWLMVAATMLLSVPLGLAALVVAALRGLGLPFATAMLALAVAVALADTALGLKLSLAGWLP